MNFGIRQTRSEFWDCPSLDVAIQVAHLNVVCLSFFTYKTEVNILVSCFYLVYNGPIGLNSTAGTNNSRNYSGFHNTSIFLTRSKSAVGLSDFQDSAFYIASILWHLHINIFFIYSRYRSSIRYKYCEYFLPIQGCIFHFISGIF